MLAERHLELILLDAAVRECLADVPIDTGGAQGRPGDPVAGGLLCGEDTDALGAGHPDGIVLEEVVVLIQPPGELFDDGGNVVLPTWRQVCGHPSGSDEVVVHPQSGCLLEEGEDLLSLPEAVHHHGDGPDVHAVRGQRNEMRRASVQLAEENPDCGRPRRDVDPEKPLDGKGVGQLVVEWSQVVHTGHVGAALGEVELLPRLLHPGVEVSDDRLGAPDDLPLQLDLESEHAMGGRVLGAHVEDHPLVLFGLVVEHVIVLDHPPELLVETPTRLVDRYLLSALVRRRQLRLLGAGHPDVEGLGVVAHLSSPCGFP